MSTAEQIKHAEIQLDPPVKPQSQRKVGRQQRDVMAGRAIDLHELALPNILDPRQVQGSNPVFVRGMF
jgi:hypothetical protein